MENLLFCHLSGEKDDKANITELDHRHRHAPNCHPLAPRLNYHLGILWELCDCGWGLLHPDKFFGSEQCIDQHLAAVCYYIIAPNDMQRNYLKFNFRTANSGHKTHTHTHTLSLSQQTDRQTDFTHTHTHTDNCKCNSNKFSSISVFGLCLLSAFSHFLRSSSWKSAALTTVAVFKYLHDFRLLAQLSFKMAVKHTHTHSTLRATHTHTSKVGSSNALHIFRHLSYFHEVHTHTQ